MVFRSHAWKAGWIALLSGAVLAVPDGHRDARGELPAAVGDLPADAGLSVLTYNVEGLPWPIRSGREDALGGIAMRLRLLRSSGRQPHVVLLQEAFTDAARRIGADAGYRYISHGPEADAAGEAPASARDRAFHDERSLWKGERSGKLLGSGLEILSDYPILAVHRQPFPAHACAGYDCIANKGMVMAIVAVPGQPTPVAMVNVHLNARRASGVSRARSLYAYREQVDAIDAFLRRHAPEGMPLIVAGDFNIGQDRDRRAYVDVRLGHWWARTGGDAFRLCADAVAGCRDTMSADAFSSFRRGKDRQFVASGGSTMVTIDRIAVPFGRESDGGMLSDHIGYAAYYRFEAPRPLPATPSHLS